MGDFNFPESTGVNLLGVGRGDALPIPREIEQPLGGFQRLFRFAQVFVRIPFSDPGKSDAALDLPLHGVSLSERSNGDCCGVAPENRSKRNKRNISYQ